MRIIKKVNDIKGLEEGQSYILDTFSPPDQEDQLITEKMLAERDRLQAAIDRHLDKLKAKS